MMIRIGGSTLAHVVSLTAITVLLIGCVGVPGQSSGGAGGGPATTALPADTRAMPAPTANPVRIDSDMIRVVLPREKPVALKVGQRINVQPTIAGAWDVDFDAKLLSLTPGIKLGEPPAQGWTWVAQQPGETEIRFDAKAPPCDPKTQQCPNVPAFSALLKLSIAP